MGRGLTRRLPCVVVILGLLLLGGPSPRTQPVRGPAGSQGGTTGTALAAVIPMAVEELVARADHVFLGLVKDVRARQDPAGGGIVTDVSVVAEEYLKSRTFPPRVILVLPGGTVGSLTLRVEDVPTFVRDERVLLFLRERAGAPEIVGAWQGVFRIRGGTSVQAESNLTLPLGELKARIQSVVRVPPPAYGGFVLIRRSPEELARRARLIVVGFVEEV
ncbi:MAG: hypothetical protein ACRELA_25555, partial [Candidatus Rokuibacteriota bacterium]